MEAIVKLREWILRCCKLEASVSYCSVIPVCLSEYFIESDLKISAGVISLDKLRWGDGN